MLQEKVHLILAELLLFQHYLKGFRRYLFREREFKAPQRVETPMDVAYSLGPFSLGDIHVNNVESYFALLEPCVHGIFHHVSKMHLDRYCDEFSFRWNHRKINDDLRTEAVIAAVAGKRLMYQELRPVQ